jgi:hypothetical protein
VSVDEYLNTSYEPDMEYADGVLVEKGPPTIAHNRLPDIMLCPGPDVSSMSYRGW